jgi:hypothetical protein
MARSVNIVTRLELNLKAAVGAAMADLIAADLRALWTTLEPMLTALPDAEQLRMGGMAIAELAEICQLKAERMLANWEEQQNEVGPAMAEDLLAGLVQRTMYLELSDLIRQPQPRRRLKSQQSKVAIIPKADLLALLGAQELAESETCRHAEALAVAHQENLSVWVGAVANWMRAATFDKTCDAVPLSELQRSLNMPLIELWLALLLGGYELESRGGFYETEQIWITVA